MLTGVWHSAAKVKLVRKLGSDLKVRPKLAYSCRSNWWHFLIRHSQTIQRWANNSIFEYSRVFAPFCCWTLALTSSFAPFGRSGRGYMLECSWLKNATNLWTFKTNYYYYSYSAEPWKLAKTAVRILLGFGTSPSVYLNWCQIWTTGTLLFHGESTNASTKKRHRCKKAKKGKSKEEFKGAPKLADQWIHGEDEHLLLLQDVGGEEVEEELVGGQLHLGGGPTREKCWYVQGTWQIQGIVISWGMLQILIHIEQAEIQKSAALQGLPPPTQHIKYKKYE